MGEISDSREYMSTADGIGDHTVRRAVADALPNHMLIMIADVSLSGIASGSRGNKNANRVSVQTFFCKPGIRQCLVMFLSIPWAQARRK